MVVAVDGTATILVQVEVLAQMEIDGVDHVVVVAVVRMRLRLSLARL